MVWFVHMDNCPQLHAAVPARYDADDDGDDDDDDGDDGDGDDCI